MRYPGIVAIVPGLHKVVLDEPNLMLTIRHTISHKSLARSFSNPEVQIRFQIRLESPHLTNLKNVIRATRLLLLLTILASGPPTPPTKPDRSS